MAKQVSVNKLRQGNLFLSDSGSLEGSPKLMAAVINGKLDVVWVKYKNTLTSNNDAVLMIDLCRNKVKVIKRYKDEVFANKVLREFMNFLVELGLIVEYDAETSW